MTFVQLKKDEGLKASKFLKQQFFIQTSELKEFFSIFPKILYIPTGVIFSLDQQLPTINDFFISCQEYENRLISENIPTVQDIRTALSGAFSVSKEAFGIQLIEGNKKLYKPVLPVMQFQLYSFFIGIDKKVHFTFGKDATYIGLQVLFPQLFIDNNQEVKNGLKIVDSPNAELFKNFVSFLRDNTSLISFAIDDQIVKSTIRMSENIFQKIKNIPRFNQIRMG